VNQRETTAAEHDAAPRQSTAGALYLAGGIGFWITVTIAEAIYSGYSVRTNMLSDLGAVGTSTGVFFDAAVFASNLLWVIAAFLFFSRPRRLLIGKLLLPVGLLLAASSPENVYLPVHIAGALFAFVGGAAATLYDVKLVKSRLRYFALFLGMLSAISVVVLFRGYTSGIASQTLGTGGWENLILFPLIIWYMVIGASLMSNGKPLFSLNPAQ